MNHRWCAKCKAYRPVEHVHADAPSLFDEPVPLPDPDRSAPGAAHRQASDTEQQAAAAIMPKSGTWRRRVLDAIAEAGEQGLTDWEVHQLVGGMLYTVAPRRNELMRDGWIEDSGQRRRTNSRNAAIVWRMTAKGLAEWTNPS